MPKLVILRHGNTFDKGDVVTRVGGRTDLPLSVSGQAQAIIIAQTLKNRGYRFSAIYSSPLKRTVLTAEAVRDATSPCSDIKTLEALREIDYGPDENKPEDDVINRIGKNALARWEHDAIAPPGWRVDGENLRNSWRGFFDRLASEQGPILAVTSNGVARFAFDAVDSVFGDAVRKLKTAHYGIVDIDKNGSAHITAWNEAP